MMGGCCIYYAVFRLSGQFPRWEADFRVQKSDSLCGDLNFPFDVNIG